MGTAELPKVEHLAGSVFFYADMEKRRSKRVPFRLPAEMTTGDQAYQGVIENFSREGMMKVIPHKKLLDFLPGTSLKIHFQTPSGEKLILDCEIRWLRYQTNMPFGLKHFVGMEIINPPHLYNEFIQTLYEGSDSGKLH